MHGLENLRIARLMLQNSDPLTKEELRQLQEADDRRFKRNICIIQLLAAGTTVLGIAALINAY